MDITKTMIAAELIALRDCYMEEKKVLKIKMDEKQTDAAIKLKLLRKVSLYNTRITIIIESIEKLKNNLEKRYVLKLNDWQLN